MVIIASHGFLSNDKSGTIGSCVKALREKGHRVVVMNYPKPLDENKFLQTPPMTMLDELIEEVGNHDYVILLGHSLGALLSLLVAQSSEKVKGVVSLASPAELRDPLRLLSAEQREQLEKQGKVDWHREDKDVHFVIEKDFFEQRAELDVLAGASEIKCPVLIVHGSEDTAVPLDDAKELFLGIEGEKELCIIGGAGHNFNNLEKRDAMVSAVVNWVSKHQ